MERGRRRSSHGWARENGNAVCTQRDVCDTKQKKPRRPRVDERRRKRWNNTPSWGTTREGKALENMEPLGRK